jgi:hypothetical protein
VARQNSPTFASPKTAHCGVTPLLRHNLASLGKISLSLDFCDLLPGHYWISMSPLVSAAFNPQSHALLRPGQSADRAGRDRILPDFLRRDDRAGRIENPQNATIAVCVIVEAGSDEDLAVGQQGGGVKFAPGIETTSRGPFAGRWIIKFCSCQNAAGVLTTGDQHLAILKERGGVTAARGGKTAGVTKSEGCGSAWLRQHEPGTENKQRQGNRPAFVSSSVAWNNSILSRVSHDLSFNPGVGFPATVGLKQGGKPPE